MGNDSTKTQKPSALALRFANAEAYALCNGEPPGTNGADDPGGVPGRYQEMIECNLAVAFDAEIAPLVEALEAIFDWDAAENSLPPYDSDGGRAFRDCVGKCERAFRLAREALARAKGGAS